MKKKEKIKVELLHYLESLHILATGSSLNAPIKKELRTKILNGNLLTKAAVDKEKERLIRIKVAEMNKKNRDHFTSGDSSSYSENYSNSYDSQSINNPGYQYWKDMYH